LKLQIAATAGDELAVVTAQERAFHALPAVVLAILALLMWSSAAAQSTGPGFERYLERVTADELVPGADRLGPVQDAPRVAPAYRGDELVGHVYLNSDQVNSVGYSGRPIHILVGLDTEGTIVGLRLIDHHEPIVLIGISEQQVIDYLEPFLGYNPVQATAEGRGPPDSDIVSGATVTVLVMGESVVRSAVRVARALGLGGAAPVAEGPRSERLVDPEAGEVADWETLLGEGAVRRLVLTVGDVNEAFERSGDARAAARPERGEPEDVFIELYVALVSQPAIGRSLLGEAGFANLERRLEPDQHAILVAGDGRYSFKGSSYVRGGVFDRFELHQGSETIRFRDRLHTRINSIAATGAPRLREIGTFRIPEDAEFDAAEPWQLKLLVQRTTGALDRAFVSFDLGYELPDRYVAIAPPLEPAPTEAPLGAAPDGAPALDWRALALGETEDAPLWVRIWESKIAAIVALLVMLGVLTLIFFFQDILVRREKLYDRIRLAFLAVTLFWLGWVAQAQLSVVNVLAFASAVRTDFQWSYFLMDPLVFILWFSVAAALLFWGRGPFCGWLCPFGALQELTNRAAKAVKVPQLQIPWGVHERLWPIKYIIFLVLFGVSLGSLALAEILAEVEPFKTAIILRFMREWWFVAFALALLAAGLFVERFFCRYLCPLGAALAIPGRLRMFDWLKRYRECGNPCMRCFNECPVEAIHPEGHINPNECISCLHCQVLYHHDRKCPVVIQRRVRREKHLAMGQPSLRNGKPPERSPAPAGATPQRNASTQTLKSKETENVRQDR
jgi:NosR/NirI family transcriptional regulator, nitrous oxide reductase regulator